MKTKYGEAQVISCADSGEWAIYEVELDSGAKRFRVFFDETLEEVIEKDIEATR